MRLRLIDASHWQESGIRRDMSREGPRDIQGSDLDAFADEERTSPPRDAWRSDPIRREEGFASAHDERLAHPINSSTAQRPLEPVIYGTSREKRPLAASPTLTFTNPRTTYRVPLTIVVLVSLFATGAWLARRHQPDLFSRNARPVQENTPAPTPRTQPPRDAGSEGDRETLSTAPTVSPRRAIPPRALTFPHALEGLGGHANTYSPFFGSAGTIFFQAQGATGIALIRAQIDTEGRILETTRLVDDGARNFHVRPSPDAKQIAFDSDRGGERGVYVAEAGGAAARKVSGTGYAAVPSWSPDSQSLVFVRAEPKRGRVWNLWHLTLQSGRLRRLTSYAYGQTWGGSWFPDGRRIAYSHEDRLIVLDLASSTRRVYRSPQRGRLVRTPAVSPDGRQILFQLFRDGAWLLDLSSGTMRQLLADPSAEEFAWSADGQRVAYHSQRQAEHVTARIHVAVRLCGA